MLRFVPAAVLAAAALAALPACDLIHLPEESPERATYYVSANGPSLTAVPDTIYVDYMTPDGMKRDSFPGAARASWSRVFERKALTEFKLTASRQGGGTTPGFLSASLLVDGQTIAFDSSRSVASVDAANPVIERAAQ